MQYKITAPKTLDAAITLPASKSISNRALVAYALSGGTTLPTNLSDCDDTQVIIRALQHLPYEIDIMAAGTAMRFMTAFLSVNEGEHVITGTDRMKHRPIGTLVDALRRLGADVTYVGEEGFPPLKIRGQQLDGGVLSIPGNVSSQYISALLLIGPCLKKGLILKLTKAIVSKPYIDMTLDVMHSFGAKAEWTDVDTITVQPVAYNKNTPYIIENDWSAASYWYEMLALSASRDNSIVLPGLWEGSTQGDSMVRFLFGMLGVKTTFADGGVRLTVNGRGMRRMDYDFVSQPDLAQTFVTTCCAMGMPFRFTGLHSLRIKETDRIDALVTELRKLGFVLNDREDGCLSWDGERTTPDAAPAIDTYEDHRMAMAFAPLAIRFGELRINDPEVVSKSYPNYWEDLKKAGFTIETI